MVTVAGVISVVNSATSAAYIGSQNYLIADNTINYIITTTATISVTDKVKGITITNIANWGADIVPTLIAGNNVFIEYNSSTLATGLMYGTWSDTASPGAIDAEKIRITDNNINTQGANFANRYGVYLEGDYNIVTGNRIINFTAGNSIRSVGANDVTTPNILA